MQKITDSLYYIGVNDHNIDLFEGQYAVPNGMAYNSYLIKDEKIAVLDSVEKAFGDEWLSNIDEVLKGESPDYLIIQHMEPDHSGSIVKFADKYPNAKLIGNAKTFAFLNQFFAQSYADRQIVVKDGDTLDIGRKLQFVFAPMVHWPEVMLTYDTKEKTLFSADAFGKFGALDADEAWLDEARRYYIGIVGKYGVQVQSLLKKAATLDIQRICSLHGPVIENNISDVISKYDTWSSYAAEKEGVLICYTSIYGNTEKAAFLLKEKLYAKGVNVAIYDIARMDLSLAVAEAFAYGKIVFATTTYNNDIFPAMRNFISNLCERNFQNKKLAIIENGSWGVQAGRIIKSMLEGSKNIVFSENTVTIKSALNDESRSQIDALADELK